MVIFETANQRVYLCMLADSPPLALCPFSQGKSTS